jgi:hypothetical protein
MMNFYDRVLFNENAFITYNNFKHFLQKKSVKKYAIQINSNSVKIIIKNLFFNLKKLQKEINEIQPIGISVTCCRIVNNLFSKICS